MNAINIRELYSSEPLSLQVSQICMQLGITPENLERDGVSVSVAVPYGIWCSKEKALEKNKEAYDSIIQHNHLFTLVRAYGIKSLEELSVNPYSSWFLWIKIKDRMTIGQNCLILTHGHAPNRKEAYYRAKDYDDFWNTVAGLTEMYEHPDEPHEPIILKQNNNMCGSSYKEWELTVK